MKKTIRILISVLAFFVVFAYYLICCETFETASECTAVAGPLTSIMTYALLTW